MKTFLSQALKYSLLVILMVFVGSCSNDNEAIDPDLFEQSSIFELISSKESDARQGAPMPGGSTLATLAINSDDFEELEKAVIYVSENTDVDVVGLLSGTDQYTVFAPNDTAFENLYSALGVSTIEEVDAGLVLNVLLYHVTEGRRASNSVVPRNNVRTIETALGATFDVTPGLMINAIGNQGMILNPDISASNGIIHEIDTVLLPIVL